MRGLLFPQRFWPALVPFAVEREGRTGEHVPVAEARLEGAGA